MWKKILSLLLVLALALALCPAGALAAETSLPDALAKTQAYLKNVAEASAPEVGSTYGEWLVLGLARNGLMDADFLEDYYDNVVSYVESKIDANGRLHKNKSTDNSRVILALAALGKDVTDVGGHDLLQGLTDTSYVPKQGINGPVWALIALDCGNYAIPENADPSKQVTREWLIDYILDSELNGGGWTIGTQADDMTPMAVQALAPYYNTNSQVKAAVDRALPVMDAMQATASSETLAQIMVARCALGLDCQTVFEKMMAYALPDGSFKHTMDGSGDQMATEQAFYAMVAYSRMLNGKTRLYDMTDVLQQQYAVTLDDRTGGAATVTGISSGQYAGETSFTVSCDEACAVAYSTDGGKTYTRLAATAVRGSYRFTVNMTANTTIVIVKKGDANLNGSVANQDATIIKAANLQKRSLTPLEQVGADVNGNGSVNNQDVTKLKAALLQRVTLGWDTSN